MKAATIYHNQKCSKSRGSLDLLREKGYEPEIIEYLTDTPSKEQLQEICKKMGGGARSILREKESLWQDTYKAQDPSDDELLDIMIAHPIMIERPIVV
ncbi:MAG: arsenate reductase (glutaredoxin), partial [Planctomycetes bacterium]|nr:arsenate reductase (glutaredoxin) [Planctomycetota bacterium]